MGNILVGTASWTDKTLLESGWYPGDVDTPEKRLRYYAEKFPVVEVDSTYYTPPTERNSSLWASRTPENFTFNIKAFSLLTLHPTRPGALYKDLRIETDKTNIYLKDLASTAVDAVWERFLGALEPLYDAGKLGVLLFQFPPWFSISRQNKEYILRAKERCTPYQICVEFRNFSWLSDRNREETLDFLRSYAVPLSCVDMPQGYRSSVPPVLATTADLAVLRFHGHSDKWTSHNIYERFGYHYSEAELHEWAPKVRQLADEVRTTHVIMNNCYRNYAQTNAEQLTQILHAARPRP
ncbi:DUF72 domain-containing protein [Actinopolymorpha alba]|uniref:DUF72 domain-containing protein n=1 Tax=Actinopolymorpha alba TaxID=533267 RepID=UPI000360A5BF|nr:DUF72 domain-containing protein [Actinopolymorpha alba]